MKSSMLYRVLREHPYLIDDSFVRSRPAAKKIVQEKNFLSCAAFIKRAKLKSKLRSNAWRIFEQALDRHV